MLQLSKVADLDPVPCHTKPYPVVERLRASRKRLCISNSFFEGSTWFTWRVVRNEKGNHQVSQNKMDQTNGSSGTVCLQVLLLLFWDCFICCKPGTMACLDALSLKNKTWTLDDVAGAVDPRNINGWSTTTFELPELELSQISWSNTLNQTHWNID